MAENPNSSDDKKPSETIIPAGAPQPTIHHSEVTPPHTATVVNTERWYMRLWSWYKDHKLISLPLTVIVLVLVLVGVPTTRYPLLGLFLKAPPEVQVLDSKTNNPVSGANVTIANIKGKTDAKGLARLGKVKVGSHTMTITKKYYVTTSQKIVIKPSKSIDFFTASVVATGRQVPIHVVNKLTGKVLFGITIKASGTEAQTDETGNAILVLPPNQSTVEATLSGKSYNDNAVKIKVTESDDPANHFTITPAGKVYFLSKQSGKIDVVKTNLDGTNRQTVLAGTGNEDDQDTVLLATRDWKYLALKSRRAGTGATDVKMYVIDTSNDQLSTMDEGDANFQLVGWTNHGFVYIVNRNNVPAWQPNAVSLKSYDADTGKLRTLDSSAAVGNSNSNAAYEGFSSGALILNGRVVYAKTWYLYPGYLNIAGHQNTLNSINPDGTGKKTISSVDSGVTYFSSVVAYEPNELLIQVSNVSGEGQTFYKLSANGNYSPSPTSTTQDIAKTYPTYLTSPSGKSIFWYEQRDGKNTLFVADADGQNAKEIGNLTSLVPYGWYTDDYLLVSKNNSELYIGASGHVTDQSVIKVSDYHKPAISFIGYGGGYGVPAP